MTNPAVVRTSIERLPHSNSLRQPATHLFLVVVFVIVCLLGWVPGAAAQTGDERPSPLVEITKQVFTDPTTYLPSGMLYTSMQLDWNSSQPFFANGYLEQNARFTRSGLPHDKPISYAAGNRKLMMQSLAIMPSGIANNALNRVLQRTLTERFPEKRKLWTTLAWIERAAFASYTSYLVSSPHFEQWKKNERLAKQLGY